MTFVFPHAIEEKRPYRGLTRVVGLWRYSNRWYTRYMTFKDLRRILPVPFGWMMLRSDHRDEVLIGPWWVMWWVWLRRDGWWKFATWAVEKGWAREPHEYCYLNELEWFPKLRRKR